MANTSDRYNQYLTRFAIARPYKVILRGRTIVRYSTQRVATIAALYLRRRGFGMAYVEVS